MSNGGAQLNHFYLGASYPGFTMDFYNAGDSTTGKNVWHDEAKTTATQQIIADGLGMAWWYADGDYLVDIKDSDGILLWSRDLWKMTSDTGTLWEGNQGTQYPPASSSNSGQVFALVDGSSNIVEIGYNDGSGFRRVAGPEDVVSKSADHTVALNEGVILVDASGGSNLTMTLHTAATRKGKRMIVEKTDSTSSTVIIDADGSETIDGSATQTLSGQYHTAVMVSDGVNWILEFPVTHDHSTDAFGGDIGDATVGQISATDVTFTGSAAEPPDTNTLTKDNIVGGWANIDCSGTPSYNDSFNTSGEPTDNGTGDMTITWDTDFADANYCWVGGARDTDDSGYAMMVSAGASDIKTAGTLQVRAFNHSASALDSTELNVIAMGAQ
jgi:hypothetical protein